MVEIMTPYTMTDAMVLCMRQPGAVAVAFVEMKTGMAIAGDGVENLDIDAWTPLLTKMLLAYYPQQEDHTQGDSDYRSNQRGMDTGRDNVPDITITMKDQIHLLYPLSGEGVGMYLYLALDSKKGVVPLGRRCLIDIDANLHL